MALLIKICESRGRIGVAWISCAAFTWSGMSLPAFAELPAPMPKFSSGGGSYQVSPNGTVGTVNQKLEREIFNWAKFNVSAGSEVVFKQPSAGSVALNRIFDNAPSAIFGKISANGSIYLINRNGIVFGDGINGGQVDVNGRFLATTLNINDAQFLNSNLFQAINNGEAALVGHTDAQGNALASGAVKVESGFTIKTGAGGDILIFAPEIVNKGTLQTPGGSTVLAASHDRVYLTANTADDSGSNLGGILVEVDTGGDVNNIGKIIAERGSVTLLGLAVKQNGHIRATTTVDNNGAIRLLARDKASHVTASQVDYAALGLDGAKELPANLARATRSGTVTIGAGSVTEVVPDAAATEVADAQPQKLSLVDVMGSTVAFEAGSTVRSTGGEVRVNATQDPTTLQDLPDNQNTSRIHVDSSAVIDVAGARDVELSMSRNVIKAELRGTELADSPLHRDGILRGKTVFVDARKGTKLANIEGYKALTPRTVSERLSKGGTIKLRSEGDLIVNSGAKLDISGGSLNYQAGLIQTTKLMQNGKVVDISDADPDQPIDAILGRYSVTDGRWGITTEFGGDSVFTMGTYVDAFTEGKAAGAIDISAGTTIFNGDIAAHTKSGPWQRTPEQQALAGSLSIDTRGVAQDVVFSALRSNTSLKLDEPSAVPGESGQAEPPVLTIADDLLRDSGLRQVSVTTNGRVSQQADSRVELAAGKNSKLAVSASDIDIAGEIRVAGGTIDLKTKSTAFDKSRQDADDTNYVLKVRSGALLDVSGLWVNDNPLLGREPVGPIVGDGGRIVLGARGDLTLEAGSTLNADAGAHMNNSLSVHGGNGGTIELSTRRPGGSALTMDGDYHAFGFGDSGKLAIEANGIYIGNARPATLPATTLVFAPEFFSGQGFGSYALTANLFDAVIEDGAVLQLQQRNFAPIGAETLVDGGEAVGLLPSGTPLSTFATVGALPATSRRAADFSLSAVQSVPAVAQSINDLPASELRIGKDALIAADPGATLAFNAGQRIVFDGRIEAPGGSVTMTINPDVDDARPRSSQGIWLLDDASISVAAAFVPQPSELGAVDGRLFDAGSITLDARGGSVVAQTGSLLDVSGAAQSLTRVQTSPLFSSRIESTDYALAAGAIDVRAEQGIFFDSTLRTERAALPNAKGASLAFRLNANDSGRDSSGGFDLALQLVDVAPTVTVGLESGIAAADRGRAVIGAQKINAAQLDSLTLEAQNWKTIAGNALHASGRIQVLDNVQLSAQKSVTLATTNLDLKGHDLHVQAPFLQLGLAADSDARLQKSDVSGLAPLAQDTGVLSLEGKLIDLVGNVAVAGAQLLNFQASDDIRVRSVESPVAGQILAPAALASDADIVLQAKQLYPTTLTDYRFDNSAGGDDASIHIAAAPGERQAVLSAGGKLKFTTGVFRNEGVIVAPLGQIAVDASKQATLANGSLTSVSADGLTIPLGRVLGGDLDWLYPLNGQASLPSLAEKRVDIDAPAVAFDEGATIDIAGGGKVYATEFTPGPGGSKDVLAPENSGGSFAIVPGLGNGIAAYDALEMQGSNVTPGDVVTLRGVPGLADGNYTVLPARYALLPGAYLVTPRSDSGYVAPGVARERFDGSWLVAGKMGVAGTAIADSNWSGFVVAPRGSVVSRSQYTYADADKYFATKGLTPKDAGAVLVAATDSLALDGVIDSASPDGLGGRLDISADRLAVVAQYGTEDGFIELLDSSLQGLGVDSLLLGGRRTVVGTDMSIDTTAQAVKVAAGASLSGPEIILAASDNVTLASNATLAGTGRKTQQSSSLNVAGDGALVRVSSSQQVGFTRTAASGATPGELQVEQGATLRADAAALLDASGSAGFAGDLDLQGGSLSLNAGRIALGGNSAINDALHFSDATLAALDIDELRVNSRSSIDFYGAVDLGLQRLEMAGQSLRNRAGAGIDVLFKVAEAATVKGVDNTASAAGSLPGGTLSIAAGELVLGDAGRATTLAVDGFAQTVLGGSERAVGRGELKLNNGGDLALDTPLLTMGGAGKLSADAAGTLTVRNSTGKAPASAMDFAGTLALSGERVVVDTQLRVPAGRIDLTARSGDVELRSGALLDTSGVTLRFGESVVATADGGAVNLRALQGNVQAAAGAHIDVSAAASGSAGSLNVAATQGAVDLRASIDAAAGTGGSGGAFALDTQTLGDSSELFALLRAAGFTESIDLRQRSGDLHVAAGDRIDSERVRLRTDSGDLTLAGTISALGEKASVILAAGRDLLLDTSASLRVGAGGANHRGELTLSALNGQIDARAGSNIDLAATDSAAENGRLTIWTPRTSNDVAIGSFGSALAGVGRIDLVASKDYSSVVGDNVLNAADMASIHSDTAAYFTANETAIKGRLANLVAGGPFHLQAGATIRTPDDLNITGPIDLSTYRYGSEREAGRLQVAAGGNVSLNGELSDGLVAGTTTADTVIRAQSGALESKIVQAGESWSLALAAGSDSASSWYGDTLDGVGDVTLAANSRLRTGTGAIELFAGDDLVLAAQTSVIYTVGRADYVLNEGASANSPLALQPDTGVLSPIDLYRNVFANRVAYAEQGGDISIDVGGDIDAANSNQLFTDWLQRAQGTLNDIAYNTWAVASARFQQGVATLGGGNIDVRAGGNINNLSVSTPTTGKQVGDLAVAQSLEQAIEINGGGDIDVRAGGDIHSLRLLVDRGAARVDAQGDIGAMRASDGTATGFDTLVAIGAGDASFRAGGDIAFAGVFNQTMLAQSILQNKGVAIPDNRKSHFFTYSEQAALNAQSRGGNVSFSTNSAAFAAAFSNLQLADNNATTRSALQMLPPVLNLEALQGNIELSGDNLTLYPSIRGNLRLVAGGDIVNSGADFTLRQSDADASLLPTALKPAARLLSGTGAIDEVFAKLFAPLHENPLTHAATPLHAGDAAHSVIAAGGNIGGDARTGSSALSFELAQQALISAGNDVADTTFYLQHNNLTDHSQISAGRDVVYGCERCDDRGVTIAGAGMLEVSAGRDIDLGAAGGILSIGDRDNPALATEGADIRLMAGINSTPAYAAFAEKYLQSPDRFPEQFVHFLYWSAPDAVVYGLLQAQTGLVYNNRDAAIAALQTLPRSTVLSLAKQAYAQSPALVQRDLISAVYIEEVQRGGVEDVTGKLGDGDVTGFARSYAAISTLFPGESWSGDISLVFSTIQTQRGGNIDLLTPGGGIDVGLAGTFAGTTKTSGQLGIMAQSFGSVRAVVRNNINVNASRIFALDGGDLMLWSSQGDIDAGRGAKTALTIPPPRRVLNPDTGQFETELPAALSGSGIQAADNTLTATPGRFARLTTGSAEAPATFDTKSTAGTGYFFAPKGKIDAGDAGIDLDGIAIIGGETLVNMDNINIDGGVIGIPVSTSVGASLAGIGDAANSATESATSAMNAAMAETATTLAESGAAFVTVDIVGVGE
jgi:filamentous hemagglutinin